MWRESFLFYLTLIFIGANLASKSLLEGSGSTFTLLFCAAVLLLLSALVFTAVTSEKKPLPIFVFIFLLMGALNFGLGGVLGEYRLLEELSGSDWISELRNTFSARLEEVIPPENRGTNSLLTALTMGDKGGIPRELKEAYRLSGAMHLLALSGLHVGFIYGMLNAVFMILPRTRGWGILKGSAIILLLIFYAVFSGASPSICRAVLMASVYEIGGMLGRERNGLNSLSISALAICCINPDAPSSISFQLSYCAMLGIFLIYPGVRKAIDYVTQNKMAGKVWNMAMVSLCCQIFTAPLTLLYFGSFPLISLLTNTITAPVVAAVMSVAPAAIILADVPLLGEWSTTLLSYSIQTLNLLIEILSRVI